MRKDRGSSQEVFGVAMKTALPGRREAGQGAPFSTKATRTSSHLVAHAAKCLQCLGAQPSKPAALSKASWSMLRNCLRVPCRQRKLLIDHGHSSHVLKVSNENSVGGGVVAGFEDGAPSLGGDPVNLLRVRGVLATCVPESGKGSGPQGV